MTTTFSSCSVLPPVDVEESRFIPGSITLPTSVIEWLRTPAATLFEEGIQKLAPRHDKCLNLCGDYVEK